VTRMVESKHGYSGWGSGNRSGFSIDIIAFGPTLLQKNPEQEEIYGGLS